MDILVVGLSHKTAPVEIREKVAFAADCLHDALERVRVGGVVPEAVIVSTCNRVEVYAAARDRQEGVEQVVRFFADYHDIPLEELRPHLYVYEGPEAVRHVFRVASSLDSMVVGEPQILGQVKDAYEAAAAGKATGLVLNKFMHKAFSTAKRVRTETAIAQSAVSVSFAAVQLARAIFGTLEGKSVLVIGAGEMCELAVTHLVENGVREVQVTNRTLARAEELAARFGGRAVPFEEFSYHLPEVDIVISSTGAPHFVLGVEAVRSAMKARKQKPMFLIDIAVPRDIDPRINDLANVYLYDVDDLQSVVEQNKKEREKEAAKAEQIVAEEVESFQAWLKTLEVTPTIRALRERFDAIRKAELEKTLRVFGDGLTAKQRKSLEAMSQAIVNKILHEPTVYLKRAANDPELEAAVDAVRRLFGLDEGEER
ncbi:MAG: glutamyl-tRNA reductase [Candidatus Dadabacteria bacterium]|nr:MAG: glutamyl-tRNA reductase [Candidatus Dadabacteria bacterium]